MKDGRNYLQTSYIIGIKKRGKSNVKIMNKKEGKGID